MEVARQFQRDVALKSPSPTVSLKTCRRQILLSQKISLAASKYNFAKAKYHSRFRDVEGAVPYDYSTEEAANKALQKSIILAFPFGVHFKILRRGNHAIFIKELKVRGVVFLQPLGLLLLFFILYSL